MAEKRKTVLIVEDDKLISEALKEGLERAGVDVLTAGDGEEGLKVAYKQHPDSIILDLMMPKKSGHEVLDEIRKDKWGSKVPIMVLTNASDNFDIFYATNYGNINYAIKSSLKLEDIVRLVKSRLYYSAEKS